MSQLRDESPRRAARAARQCLSLLMAAACALGSFAAAAQSTGDPTYRPPRLLRPDIAPPVIKIVKPSADSVTADRTTRIQLHVADPIVFLRDTSRLYVPSLSFTINGVDRSANVTVLAEGLARWFPWLIPPRTATIIYQPTTAAPLPEGPVSFTFAISDRAGNRAQATSQFVTDTTAPSITAVSPAPGEVITDVNTSLTFRIVDTGAGLNPATLAVTFAGEAGAGTPSLAGDALTVAPPAGGWLQGSLGLQIVIDDAVGNRATTPFAYTVSPGVALAAYPRAVPSTGEAPLRVVFTPNVTTTTAIERYEWDFQGDGTFDITETVGGNQTFTYTTPGEYVARLRITDTGGETATGTVQINVGNRPPDVVAEASPSNGAPPLVVNFAATATDSNGIATYEWDFQGDGSFDVSSATNTVSFTYAASGTFQPRLRVTDTLGASTTLAVPSIEVRVVAGAPTVTGSVTPATGNAPLNANFTATVVDPDGQAVTQWGWDFNGDGIEEYTSATTASTSYRYTAPGTYYARVRATTADGGMGYDVVRVLVNLSLTLTLSTDTIDASLPGAASINTTLGGDTQVSLVIEDMNGAVVRTLVPFTDRLAGPYTDLWDGRDSEGDAVPEGQYRAILLYRFDTETRRFDLGLTTGGAQSNPPRSSIPARFAPFAGRPLVINYTLGRASEVTSFMGRFNVNTRLITFDQREVKGRGTHTIVWNGENTDGQLIHPPAGDSFLFGIFAYTLPNNAIYVRSGVHISAVSSAPSIYDPTGLADDGSSALSTVNFTLNRAGAVELSIYDAETGELVLRRTVNGLASGVQSVQWDGRNAEGVLVAPGRYRLGVAGMDETGARSTVVYSLQRVYY